MWRGAIALGRVRVAVRVYTATEEHDLRLHLVHRADGGRVRHARRCELCGAELTAADVVSAHQLEDGRQVIVERAELEALAGPDDRLIEVVRFVPVADVHPIYFERAYHLAPEPSDARAYQLLHRALTRTNRLALARVALRRRDSAAVLHTWQDGLVLHTLRWHDEIRDPEFTPAGHPMAGSAELAALTELVTRMSGGFTPELVTDRRQTALARLVRAKATGADIPKVPAQRDDEQPVDLLTALRRSAEDARSER